MFSVALAERLMQCTYITTTVLLLVIATLTKLATSAAIGYL